MDGWTDASLEEEEGRLGTARVSGWKKRSNIKPRTRLDWDENALGGNGSGGKGHAKSPNGTRVSEQEEGIQD